MDLVRTEVFQKALLARLRRWDADKLHLEQMLRTAELSTRTEVSSRLEKLEVKRSAAARKLEELEPFSV